MYYYSYNNGEYFFHTKMIENKTILKEAHGASGVLIYKCSELDIINVLEGKASGEYITTLILK